VVFSATNIIISWSVSGSNMSVSYLCTLLFVANAADTLALLMGDAMVRSTHFHAQPFPLLLILLNQTENKMIAHPPRDRSPLVHSWWSDRVG
jgi:hypothetical protein